MKKFLLSIFAVLFAFAGVQAEEVTETITFDANKTQRTSFSSTEQVWTSGDVTFTNSKGASTNAVADYSNPVRLYAKSNIVISSTGGNITKIVFTSDGTTKYVTAITDAVNAGEGTVSASGSTITVTLDGTSDTYTITPTAQARLKSVAVTYTTGGEGALETLEKPVIAPDSQEFNLGESVNVTISAAEGATIYYTTDGETPTEESDVYENALKITETTTVKAIAVMDGYNNSAVAEATYTAVDPNAKTAEVVAKDLGYANSADVKEIKIGDYITVTFEKGTSNNATKYYNTGYGIRNYNGNLITFTAAAGVTINSIVFTAAGSSYIENPTNLSSGTATIDGAVTTISNIGASTLSFTQSSNTSRIQKIEVSYSLEEGVVVIATPSIAGEATFVGSTTVEITNNAEGTTLYYSTNGEDYVAYIGALNISETTTVYAKAVDAQGNESSVAEATFTKLEIVSISDAKAAYDAAGANVDVAMDLTGAVVTVNSGQYLFIENETTGINIYNSSADYAVGTKFTSGYVLGTSAVYGKLHQITGAQFCNVVTETVDVAPTAVTVEELNADFDAYEGRFVVIDNVSFAGFADKRATINQEGDEIQLYNQFALSVPAAVTDCNIEGIVGRYNSTYQIFPISFSNTVEVTGAGYATLFLGYPVAIPAGVEAYVVESAEGGYVDLVKVEGVLPAETGVIIKADAGNYNFVASNETAATIGTNLLLGTAVDTDINVEAYVLSAPEGEAVGFYEAQMTDGAWLNNANKAYLPASAVTTSVASLSFRFPGTTGVEEITDNRVQSTVIYDLTGRRVEAITAPGIYIVNGKKVLVK